MLVVEYLENKDGWLRNILINVLRKYKEYPLMSICLYGNL